MRFIYLGDLDEILEFEVCVAHFNSFTAILMNIFYIWNKLAVAFRPCTCPTSTVEREVQQQFRPEDTICCNFGHAVDGGLALYGRFYRLHLLYSAIVNCRDYPIPFSLII